MTEEITENWRKLDRRTLYVTAITMVGVAIGAAVPATAGLAGGGRSFGFAMAFVLPGAAVLILGGVMTDYLHWRKTRYRIGPERVELHTGILLVKRRSLARERIRSVDLTANPLQRFFGLVRAKIGTGEQTTGSESTLTLDPVTRAEGDRLRRELLDRAPERTGERQDGALAVLDPRWIRYAPLSVVTPLLGAAAFGGVLQVSDWFGLQRGVIHWVAQLLRDLPLVVAILVLVVAALFVGFIGSLGLFVEMWWNYRLEREPGGTLRVRRGLFTTRSISIEERRLRGVEVIEPIGNRVAGAARVDAVATGMAKQEKDKTDHKTLLPSAPKDVADRVAADVLGEPVAPTAAARLRGHPVAARGRRVRWALAAVLVFSGTLAVLGVLLTEVLLHLAWISAVVLLPIGIALALDAYRNLGHALEGAYLVTRYGTVARRTVALQRHGIIGFIVRESVFQRRAGLINLTATTAAGAAAYPVPDADRAEGLAFADSAVPGLLEPFLVRETAAKSTVDSQAVRSG